MSRQKSFWTTLLLTTMVASGSASGGDLFPEETAFRAQFDATPVNLSGRVVDATGSPIPSAALRVGEGAAALAAADGTFTLTGLHRSNQLVTITAPGFYPQLLPAHLFVPLSQTKIILRPIVLWPETPSVVRFLFAGDTSFARRMLDPLERAARDQTPVDNPDALIRVSDPLPGSLGMVSFVNPLFAAVDYPLLNLESVVTLDPSTPHLQKEFVYFSLPASLPVLKTLNIDYVSLGNNHTYDYLESGVSNTCYFLDQAGLHYSGLGSNSTAALSAYRAQIKNTPVSFLAMTSIGGEQHATNYVADGAKGGAAYIESKAESAQAISAEKAAGRVTIVQTHVGDEYTLEPSTNALKWMNFAVDAGADLVVSHHPHMAQGFGLYKGVLLLHSLGNFCFDQERLETMLGLVATVDMEAHHLRGAWGMPVYLEDFRPRLTTGRLTPLLLRRLAEFSRQIRAFPYNGQAWLTTRPDQYSFQDRRIELPVAIGSNGWTILDLRGPAQPDESLARIETDAPGLTVRLGRDLMLFGDFEDIDLDSEQGEAARWDFSTNTIVARQNPYRGTAALCLYRKYSLTNDAIASFRNRIRVVGDSRNTPNKDLSLLGYVRGDQAGRITITSRYYASEGTNEFGEELALDLPGGSFSWQPFMSDLHMPPDDPTHSGEPTAVNARAARIFLHHSPPAAGAGYVSFDELALVSWEQSVDPLPGPALNTPHGRDFLRVQGPPGSYLLALTFRSYNPIQADSSHGPHLAIETDARDQSVDHLWFPAAAIGGHHVLSLLVRNQGNQDLLLGNPAFSGENTSDFRARWLNANGTNSGDTAMLPPQTSARLEVQFIPTSAGRREATLQFQSNDPDETQSSVTILVTGLAFEAAPLRFITRNRTLSPTVHIQVPLTATVTNLLIEQLPPGIAPFQITHAGVWSPASRTIQWHDLPPATTASYSIAADASTPPTQPLIPLLGWLVASLPSQVQLTTGQPAAILLDPDDSDHDGLPDWWELKFFDSRTAAIPELDSDADGQKNLTEYLAGTHPLDSGFHLQPWAPYLRVLAVDQESTHLQLLGSDAITYRLEVSPDLSSWETVLTNVFSGEVLLVPRPKTPDAFFRAASEQQSLTPSPNPSR